MSKIDQENLHMKVLEWKRKSPKDHFFSRSHGKERIETEEGEELLFYNEHGERIPSEEKVNQL